MARSPFLKSAVAFDDAAWMASGSYRVHSHGIANPDPVVRRHRYPADRRHRDYDPVESGTLVNGAGYKALPERLLWRCVLLQAIYDAKGGRIARKGRHTTTKPRKGDALRQREALAWFGTPDFYTVCDLADMEPDVAKRAVAP